VSRFPEPGELRSWPGGLGGSARNAIGPGRPTVDPAAQAVPVPPRVVGAGLRVGHQRLGCGRGDGALGQTARMPIGRAARRESRRDRVVAALGEAAADPALDLLELVELAWHDCYGVVTPPEGVVDDILLLSRGNMADLVTAAHLAVTDWRDARVAADALRG